MTQRKPIKLGQVQLQIMQILWAKGSASAREITDQLSTPTAPIAHSTVQTLLRKLEAKGAITHTQQERTFLFQPLCEHDDVVETAARDLLTRVFGGSVSGLVSHLLQHEHITQDELEKLRSLVNDAGTGKSSKSV